MKPKFWYRCHYHKTDFVDGQPSDGYLVKTVVTCKRHDKECDESICHLMRSTPVPQHHERGGIVVFDS